MPHSIASLIIDIFLTTISDRNLSKFSGELLIALYKVKSVQIKVSWQ